MGLNKHHGGEGWSGEFRAKGGFCYPWWRIKFRASFRLHSIEADQSLCSVYQGYMVPNGISISEARNYAP